MEGDSNVVRIGVLDAMDAKLVGDVCDFIFTVGGDLFDARLFAFNGDRIVQCLSKSALQNLR